VGEGNVGEQHRKENGGRGGTLALSSHPDRETRSRVQKIESQAKEETAKSAEELGRLQRPNKRRMRKAIETNQKAKGQRMQAKISRGQKI